MSDSSKASALATRMVHTLPGWGLWANDLRDFETPYGRVGFRQASVLWVLVNEVVPESHRTPTGIARRFGVQNSAITRAVEKLIAGGYLTRTISDRDRRLHLLEVTERGRNVSNWILHLYTAPLQEELETLNPEEMESLATHVEQLYGMISRIRNIPMMEAQ